MARKNLANALALTLVVLVSACTLGPREQPSPRTYLLNPEVSLPNPGVARAPRGSDVLLVTPIKAGPAFDTARMAYLLRPHEINYYALNQWADTPARMLTRAIVTNLDKTGLWDAVVQTPGTVQTPFRLDCDDLILEQQFFSRPSRVRLALRVQLVASQKPETVDTRYFEIFEETTSDDPYGGVLAANRAAARLITEVVDWLGMVMKRQAP